MAVSDSAAFSQFLSKSTLVNVFRFNADCRSYATRVFDALLTRSGDGKKVVSPPAVSAAIATPTVILPTSSSDVEAETKLIPSTISPVQTQQSSYEYDCEEIDFEKFIKFLSCILRGSDVEKLDWCFQLYDRDNEGRLTQKNVVDFVFSIYQLINDEPEPSSAQYDLIHQQAVRTYQVSQNRKLHRWM